MSAPYQRHSETSRSAASLNVEHKQTIKEAIYGLIQLTGIHGLTGKEIAHQLDIAIGTASARLRELQQDGRIRKSPDKRTYSHAPGCEAESFVWKLPEFVPIEAETKRDKAKEALDMVMEERRKQGKSLDLTVFLNRLYAVLK